MENSKYILTIDDNESFNKILAKFLGNICPHHRLFLTTNHKEFFEILNNSETGPDLIIIDLRLDSKETNGLKIVKSVKSDYPDIPVLVISRMSEKALISYALELGASDYLNKPIDLYILENKIEQILHGPRKHIYYSTVPLNRTHCSIDIKLELRRITEQGIYLVSNSFVKKGGTIELESSFLSSIFNINRTSIMRVSSVKTLKDHRYELFFEFDPMDTVKIGKVRTWIAKKKQNDYLIQNGSSNNIKK